MTSGTITEDGLDVDVKPLPAVLVLAQQFILRADRLGFKGYRRDKLAVEFFLGAGVALQLAGHPEAASVQAATTNIIAHAGFMGVRRLAGML